MAPTHTLDRARTRLFISPSFKPSPLLPTSTALQPRTRLSVSVADCSSEGLAAAAYDKRTGEWKAKATGGRRADFGAHTLRDHHVDDAGADLGRRKQQSNFFLTINTNRRKFEGQDPAALEYALNETFKTHFTEILTFGPKHPDTYAGDADWAHEVIESVTVKAGVERGPITGSLHAHLYLTINHWSQLQLNIPVIQHRIKERYNSRASAKGAIPPRALPAVRVDLCPQTDYGQIIAHYLSKQIGTAE